MGPELHNVSRKRRTPFLNVLEALTSQYIDCKLPPLIGCLKWLIALAIAGVDLVEYGHRECELCQEGKVSWEWKGGKFDDDDSAKENLTWTLESLRYGTSPLVWKFIIGVVDEETSSDVEKIPGAWIEDDKSEANVLEDGDSVDSPLGDDNSEDKDSKSNGHGEEDFGGIHREEANSDMESSNSVRLEGVDSEDSDSEDSNLESETSRDVHYDIYQTEKGHLKKEFLFDFSKIASRYRSTHCDS